MRRLRYSVPYIAGKSLPKDSDPAPRGAGPASCSQRSYFAEFQSTRPLRGGTLLLRSAWRPALFQSTRPLRGGTNTLRHCNGFDRFQSTRPLRGGTARGLLPRARRRISIHPPLAGRDFDDELAALCREAFQSTRPLRGGTPQISESARSETFQSTRPLRGGTLCWDCATGALKFQSPAPCGAGLTWGRLYAMLMEFQSTRPLRGGTWL